MKEYIVKATVDIETVIGTDKPENVKSILESAFEDICDISVEAKNICIRECSEGLSDGMKSVLENAFLGRRTI